MKILNRKANYQYKLESERFEAGIALSGGEVKAVRNGRGDISQSYAKVLNGEIFLINANLPVLGAKTSPTRSRKLLLHKSEITSIITKAKQQKLTLIPTKLYTKGRLIKAELALGKSKKKYEKRESIKKKDIERQIEQEFRIKL
ncbi:MAG: SsrA-binding protein SmpB [Patescibacteria group bacterium]